MRTGYLTDKDALPVKEMRFGDVDENSGEKGNFTLGALHCKWTHDNIVPSCDALQRSGVTKSGVFRVNKGANGETVKPYEVTCNFTDTGSVSSPINLNKFTFNSCGQVSQIARADYYGSVRSRVFCLGGFALVTLSVRFLFDVVTKLTAKVPGGRSGF